METGEFESKHAHKSFHHSHFHCRRETKVLFIINHFHFIFITYVTYTQFFTAFCVCLEQPQHQHKPHFTLLLSSRFMCGDEKSTFSFTFDGTTLLIRTTIVDFHLMEFITMHGNIMWIYGILLCKHFITLALSLVYVWEFSLYSHWLLCRLCVENVSPYKLLHNHLFTFFLLHMNVCRLLF